jgi:CrcB protein
VLTLIAVAIAGGAGAAARFVFDGTIRHRWAADFPYGTLIVNITGSFLLGVLTGLVLFHGQPHELTLIAGTGFCGGYTTFSTASFETVRLLQQRAYLLAATNAIVTPLLTFAAASTGLLLARA